MSLHSFASQDDPYRWPGQDIRTHEFNDKNSNCTAVALPDAIDYRYLMFLNLPVVSPFQQTPRPLLLCLRMMPRTYRHTPPSVTGKKGFGGFASAPVGGTSSKRGANQPSSISSPGTKRPKSSSTMQVHTKGGVTSIFGELRPGLPPFFVANAMVEATGTAQECFEQELVWRHFAYV